MFLDYLYFYVALLDYFFQTSAYFPPNLVIVATGWQVASSNGNPGLDAKRGSRAERDYLLGCVFRVSTYSTHRDSLASTILVVAFDMCLLRHTDPAVVAPNCCGRLAMAGHQKSAVAAHQLFAQMRSRGA